MRYDGCLEEVKLLNTKIEKLESISQVKSIMLDMHDEQHKNNAFIIQQLEEQVKLAKKMSEDLHKELKGQKAKSFIWKAATFVGVITTSYLLITK